MIHPNMATMLGYLSCDAGVPAEVWLGMVARAVQRSFNAITVDGDTSTNDTYLAFAAGAPLDPAHYAALEEGVTAVSQHLAKAIARTVCGSSLVKTAVHGRDPNWGRIVAAAGRAGVPFEPAAVALWLGEHQLMAAGQPMAFDRPAASAYMRDRAAGAYLSDDTVAIRLSDQYVRINADYTT